MDEIALLRHLLKIIDGGCEGMDNRVPELTNFCIDTAYWMLSENFKMSMTVVPIDDVDLGYGADDFGNAGVYVFGGKFVKIKDLNEREVLDLVLTFITRSVESKKEGNGLASGLNLRNAQKTIRLFMEGK